MKATEQRPAVSQEGISDAEGSPEGGDGPREAVASAHRLSRRSLLRRGGLGVATVLVAGTGAASYRAYDTGVFSVGDGPAYAPWRTWDHDPSVRGLVGAALLAPSPHNTQAWRFRVEPRRIDLSADPSRGLGVIDPYGRELAVGLGAAVENLMLAAAARGHATALTLVPDATTPEHAAVVELASGRERRSALYAAIPRRHSNRYAFSDRPLTRSTLDPMQRLATGLGPAQLVLITDPARMRRLGELVVSATAAMVPDRQRSAVDATWIRQNWDAIQRRRDGVTLDTAGLSDWLVALAKMLPAQGAKAADDAWLQGVRDRQVPTARAWGVVAVADATDSRQRLQGGRLLERAHLWATANGIALHHLNAITERADRERQLGLPARFAPAFAALMPSRDLQPLVAFRLGYPTHSARPSPRRPVAWIAS